jgi:HORMA domain
LHPSWPSVDYIGDVYILILRRDVFPNDCYGSRVYDFSDPDPSYEGFMNGNKPFALEKNQNLAYWRVLVRGSDPGVDKFLDWLVSIHSCPASPPANKL